MTTQIGIIHPGEMGISLAATAQRSGHQVYWASAGRSAATVQRAAQHGLQDAETLGNLCAVCRVLVSVCPPHGAEAVAQQVVEHGFNGLYIDANAVTPQRAIRMGHALQAAGATFVDGGIIGPPAWKPDTTWLYLAGRQAEAAAACFSGGPLVTRLLDADMGTASALKMCFAAYAKGTTALLCSVLATAEHYGVRAALHQQWSEGDTQLAEGASRRARQVTKKAWRFVGEMQEISATFREAGLPGEFHAGAAETYGRLAQFKDADDLPDLSGVLAALMEAAASHEGSGDTYES